MGLSLAFVLAGCGNIMPTSSWPGLLVRRGAGYVTSTHGKIYALAADTGAQQWEIPVKAGDKAAKPFTALAFSGGAVLFGSFC